MNKKILIPVLTAAFVALFAQAPAFSQSAIDASTELQPLGDGDSLSSTPAIQPDVTTMPQIAPSDTSQPGLTTRTTASPNLIPIEPPAVVVDQPAAAMSNIFKLPLNKTRALEVDGRVRDIVIGNSAITDVVVRSPTQIYLVGRAIGSTNVFLMSESGAVLRQVEVQVEPDGSGVEDALRAMMPDENIRAASVGDSIVLSGSVTSDGVAQQAQQIARRFVPEDANIINMLTVGKEQQVLLRVRISELSKRATKDMSAAYTLLDPANIGGAALNYFSGFGAVAGGVLSIVNPNDYAATFSWRNPRLGQILAEPNLLTVSRGERGLPGRRRVPDPGQPGGRCHHG
jgi:pilus assembly protein CpaC